MHSYEDLLIRRDMYVCIYGIAVDKIMERRPLLSKKLRLHYAAMENYGNSDCPRLHSNTEAWDPFYQQWLPESALRLEDG